MTQQKAKEVSGKEYVIIYQSQEHYEVLGHVRASSMEEAKKKAQEKLSAEAKYYDVSEAEIDEIVQFDKILFDSK